MPVDRADEPAGRLRAVVARVFTRVEDVVYVGLGTILAGSALVLLGSTALDFVRSALAGDLPTTVVPLLDRILLVLMIVEVLYTVQVSLREHALVPEPFLIVVLIAATRRVIVLVAEFAHLAKQSESVFRHAMIELGLLTVMILGLVVAILLLRTRGRGAAAGRD
jgi:hypothetical protein